MQLTVENYHSVEARQEFMSASRFSDYAGSLGIKGCEARALAMDKGEWEEPPTPAMQMSSYVDAHFAGRLDTFKAQNPDIFVKSGDLKAQFKHAETIIQRIERDEYFMKYLAGEKQKIFTAELFGIQWSCMIDSYLKDTALVDLKVMASLNKGFYVKDYGNDIPFVIYYGYDLQLSIYQKIVETITGKKNPIYIAGASKEEYPAIRIIGIDQKTLDDAFEEVKRSIERVKDVREGKIIGDRCGTCDYCKHTEVLDHPIHFSDLIIKV